MHSTVIRSQSTNIFLAKLWGPLLCIIATFGIFGTDIHSWRFVFASPLIIAALFGMSTAVVELHESVLRYRRFFKWTTIPNDEILAAGVVWPPFIGYLRLKRPIFPWGRLYFVLDANPNPFRRGDYALLQHLRNEPISPRSSDNTSPNKALRNNGLVLVVGIASSLMLNYLIPNSPTAGQAYPSFVAVIMQAWQRATTWPWAMLTAAFLVGLIIRQPSPRHNWILSWGVGFMLAQIAVTAIH